MRLSNQTVHVPGFDQPSLGAARVLAPIHFELNDEPAVRCFSGEDSQNTNGNSVLLRMDYGAARILFTGDLNKASQGALLRDYEGRRLEFKCDVAKACHHGSEDVSFAFMQAMEPAATIISSGDGEGHDHPRPRIVAASGVTGYLSVDEDEVKTPLVYCTELARSYQLGDPKTLRVPPSASHGSVSATGQEVGRGRGRSGGAQARRVASERGDTPARNVLCRRRSDIRTCQPEN
jgi:hypothetical protein